MGILQNIRLTRRQDEVLHEKQIAWSLGGYHYEEVDSKYVQMD